MSNLKQLKQRIADEIGRKDLDQQIERSIFSAINFYKNKALGFNETKIKIETIPKKDSYDLPADFIKSQKVIVKSGNEFLRLKHLKLSNPILGLGFPESFTFENQKLILTPVPESSYELNLFYIKEIDLNKKDNGWCKQGEELIRTRAKCDLFANVIRDFSEAMVQKSWLKTVYDNLINDLDNTRWRGYVTPTLF